MRNVQHFEEVANFIIDEDLRAFVFNYLEHYTPDYFWTDGASASGKYHPKFAQGVGGLVRHTIAGGIMLEEVLRMSPYCYLTDEHKDFCRVGILLHDTRKYGHAHEPNTKAYKMHAVNAAQAVKDYWQRFFGYPAPEWLLSTIRTHMGQWSEKECRPMTNLDRAVHTADYWASRSMIDIPGIMEKWESIEAGATPAPTDEDLPF